MPAFSIAEDRNPRSSDWDGVPQLPTPLLRIVTSLPLLASFVILPAVIAALGGPGANDQYSLVGAMVAAVITLMAVRKYDQTAMNSVCAVLGSVTVGVTCPGLLVSFGQWKGLVDDHTYNFITWHMWVLMGLVCGLCGWMVAQSIYNLATKTLPTITDWFGRLIAKYFSPPPDK
jgi:hypothetical protein